MRACVDAHYHPAGSATAALLSLRDWLSEDAAPEDAAHSPASPDLPELKLPTPGRCSSLGPPGRLLRAARPSHVSCSGLTALRAPRAGPRQGESAQQRKPVE